MKRLLAIAGLLAALGGCAVVPAEPAYPVPVTGYVVTPPPPAVYYGYRPWGYHWRHGGYHSYRGYPGRYR
ncbi:MAG TPA: hypothetical protein VHB46_11230 [Burkholderiales bacterium]|nr:hypothetical protein [Burkholderiales bacterium]